MIKNTFILNLLVFIAFFTFVQTSQAEARNHCRSSTHVQVGVSAGRTHNDAYMTRRYAQPVVVPAAPVYAAQPYYGPQYAPVVYAYPAPVYVEEVYVVPAHRPAFFGLGGLSFSWNFFK